MTKNLTLAEAKRKATKSIKEVMVLVRAGRIKPRLASEELINVYWGIRNWLGPKTRVEFDAWFKAEHEKAGKELGASK